MDDELRHLFTSESVTAGHPDKVADAIADAILDDVLAADSMARVAIEVATTTETVIVLGELTTSHQPDVESIVRRTVRGIGYDDPELGFDADSLVVTDLIKGQSPDIAQGVDHAYRADSSERADELGAGDQGMMFGYATDETPAMMPMPVQLAHELCRRLAEVRQGGVLPFLRPDGKSQVTVAYGPDRRPGGVHTVLVSTQHHPDISVAELTEAVAEHVVDPVVPLERGSGREVRLLVNPSGRFVIGGPAADSGLSGRKIIVDTYGGMARHGGGSFSGKDPTKVDRSGAYAARWVAKNVVAAGLARRCEIQVAYAIGVAEPLALNVDTFGTGVVPDPVIGRAIARAIDLRPGSIIERLALRRPIYRPTAAYGHFGRTDLDLSWERTDIADELRSAAGLAAVRV